MKEEYLRYVHLNVIVSNQSSTKEEKKVVMVVLHACCVLRAASCVLRPACTEEKNCDQNCCDTLDYGRCCDTVTFGPQVVMQQREW